MGAMLMMFAFMQSSFSESCSSHGLSFRHTQGGGD